MDSSRTGDSQTKKASEVLTTSDAKASNNMPQTAKIDHKAIVTQEVLNASGNVMKNNSANMLNENNLLPLERSEGVREFRSLPMNRSFEMLTESELNQKSNAIVQVIDASCGAGKTSWAIQHMNANPNKQFLFVTPFLDEVKRIQAECAELEFTAPSGENGTKAYDFRRLLATKRNIVCTHNLFLRADEVTIGLLRTSNHTLIIDEVMDVIHQVNISYHDLRILKEKFFSIDEVSCRVSLTEDGKEYKGRLQEYIDYARQGRLYCFGGTVLIWQFPPEVFTMMEDMYLLTYLFGGQYQRYYFDYHKIPYNMAAVSGSRDTGLSLVAHDPAKSDAKFRTDIKNNVNIYTGKYNNAINYALTYSFYEKSTKKQILILKKTLYNYYNYHLKGKATENMWTTFKEWEDDLKGKGFKTCFVPHNARATNQYADRKNLAYPIERNLIPGLVGFLEAGGVKVDADLFAVSELIQWVCRSAIRNGESVNLFLPSLRMRNLLYRWIESGSAMSAIPTMKKAA